MDLKVSKFKIIIYIMVFAAIYPFGYHLFLPHISIVYRFGKYVLLALGGLLFISRNYKPSKIFLGIFLLEVYLGIITIVQNGNLDTWQSYAIPIISLAGLVDYSVKRNPKFIISALAWISAMHLLVNYILGSRISSGMTTYWLGIRVRIGSYAFPAMAFCLIYLWMEYNEKRNLQSIIKGLLPSVITFFSSISFFLLEDVSTALLTCSVFVIMLIVFSCSPNILAKRTRIILLVILLINCGIVFLGMQDRFAWIIEGLLDRSLTLTGRTMIWDGVLSNMDGHWLFGNGLGANVSFNNRGVTYEHNQLLNLLFAGGIFAIGIFLGILFSSLNKIVPKENNFGCRVISAAILAISVEMIPEHPFENPLFAALLILAANFDYIDDWVKSEILNMYTLREEQYAQHKVY